MLLLRGSESAHPEHLLDLSAAAAVQHPRRKPWDWEDGALRRSSLVSLDYPSDYESLDSAHVLDSRLGNDSHEVMEIATVCTRLSAVVAHLCSR